MKKNENSIYDIVDENFMSNFSGKHIGFMKDYYYKVYYNFCRHIKKKILPQEVFFTNELRQEVKDLLEKMHLLYARGWTPKVKPSKACNACSLKELCVPKLLQKRSVKSYVQKAMEENE